MSTASIIRYCQRQTKKPAAIIIIILLSGALWQLGMALSIQGKAVIAQLLLQHAWQQTLNAADSGNHQNHKPWPWADTWPVAKLSAPRQHNEHIVLAGDSGSSLAFGPGHSFASAAINSSGLSMISGHRDTHFRFLEDIRIGDRLILQTAGVTQDYRVYDLQIVDSRTSEITADPETQTLLLVTCYPFDAISSGGPLRYLVYAGR